MCTWTSAFILQESKQSVNEDRIICSRESLSHYVLWQQENTNIYGILLQPEIFILPVQDFQEKISGERQQKVQSLVSKLPFYILHYLTSLIKEGGEV